MAFTNIWDDTYPPDTQLANLLGQDLRNFRTDTQQRMAAISGLDANKPNFGGDAQPNNWNGVLFFATDTGLIYQWTNPAWVNITTNFSLTSSVKRYYTAGVATTGTGQTVFTLTIPTGILGVGSVLDLVVNFVSGGMFININGADFAGSSQFSPGGQLVMHATIASLTNLTGFIQGNSGGANTFTNVTNTGQAIANVTTTPLVITGTQGPAGNVTPVGFWLTVVP